MQIPAVAERLKVRWLGGRIAERKLLDAVSELTVE
jgi:hypothetical protein